MSGERRFDLDVRGAGGEVHLVRDLLDTQLIDRNHDPMGRVDGLVLGVAEGIAPEVLCIESGITVAARRLGQTAARWVGAAARRWGLRAGKPVRIGWGKVLRVGIETEVEMEADKTAALVWEHWLLEHMVRYLPSMKAGKEEKAKEGEVVRGGVGRSRLPGRLRRVRLERLLSRMVVDSLGEFVGRVEEVRGWVRDGRCEVEEFVLGEEALLERLSVAGLSLSALGMLGARHGVPGRRVPWDRMDLSDPERPRLRCTVGELEGKYSAGRSLS